MSLELAEWREMVKQLAQPFDTMDFLPKAPSGGQALGLPYIDARDVQRRLDAVVGGEWEFNFEPLSADGKMVKGILTVRGVTRCDAGEAGREEEPLKSAVSDALKRCAVHFGIGRYLYFLPQVWAPFDPQKRRFLNPPQIKQLDIDRAVAIAISDVAPESDGDLRAQAQPKPAATSPAPANTERVRNSTERETSYAGATVDRRPGDTKPATGKKPIGAVWTAWGNLADTLAIEKNDRETRLTIWSGILDRKLETGNDVQQADEQKLIRGMNDLRQKELKEQAAARAAQTKGEDYGPFDGVPEAQPQLTGTRK